LSGERQHGNGKDGGDSERAGSVQWAPFQNELLQIIRASFRFSDANQEIWVETINLPGSERLSPSTGQFRSQIRPTVFSLARW
jgi:hypothetical protein